jgi:hypothetical protein
VESFGKSLILKGRPQGGHLGSQFFPQATQISDHFFDVSYSRVGAPDQSAIEKAIFL